ncbi:MAG: hypothetical protein NXI17_13825 [Alphaproteobacteria bacterium]|nr:hypothetical protein [Alphaproteobacteria bacterium]
MARILVPPPLCDCVRAEATLARGRGAFDACGGFDAPEAADAVADAVAGFASALLSPAPVDPVESVEPVVAVAATVAAACFTSGVGLLAATSFVVSDLVGAFGALFAAIVFTALGSRSMVVGFGVSLVAPPTGFASEEVALAPDGLDLAPVPASFGLEVDVAAAFGVRDRVEPVDLVDLDFEVGRCGDFTILWSLLRCLWME